jgi:hypothetical protein
VQDVLDAYGWRLELASSELGGLKATVAPLAVVGPSCRGPGAPSEAGHGERKDRARSPHEERSVLR